MIHKPSFELKQHLFCVRIYISDFIQFYQLTIVQKTLTYRWKSSKLIYSFEIW